VVSSGIRKGHPLKESELRALVERYAGNALALKIVATTFKMYLMVMFEFLKQDTVVLAIFASFRAAV